MERIEAKHFYRSSVALDNRHFINCEFRECELAYSGGEMRLENTVIERGCTLSLSGAARLTADFLEQIGLLGPGAVARPTTRDGRFEN